MRWSNSKYLLLVVLCLSQFLISCSATKVKQEVLMPANSNDMKSVKILAVTGFTGDKFNMFSTAVETFLGDIRIKDKPYFKIVERAALLKIMQDRKNKGITSPGDSGDNNSGISEEVMTSIGDMILAIAETTDSVAAIPTLNTTVFNRNEAIEIAKTVGADTIITGTVDGPLIFNTPYQMDKGKCVKYIDKKCVQYTSLKIDCVRQMANLKFVMNAIDVNNGKTRFSKSYEGRYVNKHCNGKGAKTHEVSYSDMADKVMKVAIKKSRKDVAPYTMLVTIELMEKDDSGMLDDKKTKLLFDTGLDFAEHNKFSQACDNFRLASQSFTTSPALLYNMGVCAEFKNDLAEASRLFSQAKNLSKTPNELIATSIARVNDRKTKNKQVAGQLR